MKPEEQRIAIAKACGFEVIGRPDQYDPPVGVPPAKQVVRHNVKPLPDYLNDLNAMHEAEKILLVGAVEEDWKRYDAYRNRLNDMVGVEDAHVASAAQRAEAFLRTLNLWTE